MSSMISGKRVSAQEEEIRGGLKYTWAEGRSKSLKPSAAENVRMETSSRADTYLTRRCPPGLEMVW